MRASVIFGILLTGFSELTAADVESVLAKARAAYRVPAIHIVAELEARSANGRAQSISMETIELAMASPGRVYASRRTLEYDAFALSDGEKSWKALPRAKAYMEIASAMAEDPSPEPAGERKDFIPMVKVDVLVRTLAVLRKLGSPKLEREDSWRVNGKKTPVWVVTGAAGARQTAELWIAQDTGFVVFHKQTGEAAHGGRDYRVESFLKVRSVSAEPPASRFVFDPPRGWQAREMLMLPGEEMIPMVNQRAASFALKNLEGEPVTLANLTGKVVVVDFWATWCPPCRAEMPHLEKLSKELAAKDVVFLAVSSEDEATLKRYAKGNGLSLPILRDGSGKTHASYGIRFFPTLFVVDRQGVVRQHVVGSRKESALRDLILAVAEGI